MLGQCTSALSKTLASTSNLLALRLLVAGRSLLVEVKEDFTLEERFSSGA